MTDAQYLEQRVDEQIRWLEGRSAFNQRWFKRLRVLEIVAAAIIPLLAGQATATPPSASFPWIVGGLGAAVAVVAGVLALFRFQENWIQYRATAEALRREKFLYLTRAEPYARAEPFGLLVQRVEAVLGSENAAWVQAQSASTPSQA